VGGAVEIVGGDEPLQAALKAALDVGGDDDRARAHVHGFHSYPARMHPTTARELVVRLSPALGTVLDPFCGSGTVLVEGLTLGRNVVGVDANPLAVELSRLKTRGSTEAERKELLGAARAVTTSAEERRARRSGATHRYGADDVALFEPHVLLELDGLSAAIRRIERDWTRRALFFVLSSILVKVSRQSGDTATGRGERRLRSGFTIDLFGKKTTELVRRLGEFDALLPKSPRPTAAVHLGDARRLERIGRASIDLVVTSPPYPGTYDYLAHHAARMRWLDLDADRFADTELGARRHLERMPFRAALARYAADIGAALAAMSRALKPSGKVVLIVADSVVKTRPVLADRLLSDLAPGAGLEVSALASQLRPHFHGPSARAFDRTPRREHAIVFRPAGGP
jgi:SAM-dependent methyltransferase